VLLGAGPGNPDLLTVAGLRALQDAEVVIADALISDQILDIARANGAELILAKKHEDGADPEQQRLNECGVEALKRGKRVLRLKGGDPFLFARGGEEILWYREHGFDIEVIPGVSSCFAAPAAAGIPVTHRGVAEQLLILTGERLFSLVCFAGSFLFSLLYSQRMEREEQRQQFRPSCQRALWCFS